MSSRSSPTPPTISSPYASDLAEVRAWIEKRIAALKFGELVLAILALITRMRDINLDLMRQLAHMRRARPRSETFKRLEGQLSLPLEGLVTRPAKPPSSNPARGKETKGSRKGKHPGRAALPAHLPRVERINAVPSHERTCPLCGRTMTTVGHEVCEILEVEPARIYVLQRKDERVACPHDDTIVSAKAPPQIVERGKLGDTLIVEALGDKYIDHQPIERQSRHYNRAGADIAPQTLGRSVSAAIDLLSPIAREIRKETRASALLATDATGLPVLDEDHPHGIRNGTMWCWVGDNKWVTFFYAPSGDARVLDFFRAFLTAGLKDNQHLFKAVLTGILRVARESIFSGLNNLAVYSLLRRELSTCFGFTEDEVRALLDRAGALDRLEAVRSWYNGYVFGGQVVYNPWSILSFLASEDRLLRGHWVATSANDSVKDLLQRHAFTLEASFQTLMEGGAIERRLDENVALGDLEDHEDALWSLLVFTGYLRAEEGAGVPGEVPPYRLSIPNREVQEVYTSTFRRWMESRLKGHGGSVEKLRGVVLELKVARSRKTRKPW